MIKSPIESFFFFSDFLGIKSYDFSVIYIHSKEGVGYRGLETLGTITNAVTVRKGFVNSN